jgi:hypothetical protein
MLEPLDRFETRIPSHRREGGSVRQPAGERDAPLQDYRERAETGGD